MIGLAAMLAAAAALPGPCGEGLCNGRALRPFFEKLAAARGRDGRPVHIVQIGDSHTAGDAITGGWRDLLQARYGSGGRGVLPPGRPYDGYITHGASVAMSPGWTIASDFGKSAALPHPPLGLSAFSLTAAAGATMAIDAEPAQAFARAIVCALARPGAGRLVIHAGDAQQTLALASPSERATCVTLRPAAPATHADLTTADGPVTIISWATFADHGGVALSNLGVVGSQLSHFARTDDALIAEEMRVYQADLIVIAFGTNEGFAPRFTAFEYELLLRAQVARLRRLAGDVPILLLGAPDALTRRPELRTNAAGFDAATCDGVPAAAPPPAPIAAGGFTSAMARIGDFLGVTSSTEQGQAPPAAPPVATVPKPPAAAGPAPRPALFVPAGIAAVRDVQWRVAQSLQLGYWDWQARMGGRCAAIGWLHSDPPLMRTDYVHYSSAGGRLLAARLQADLDAANPAAR